MCACSAASIFLFASSKLLPRTVSDSSSQTPFQPPSDNGLGTHYPHSEYRTWSKPALSSEVKEAKA
jgi:hypothetical protein